MAYVGYVGAPSQLVVNANYDVYVNGDGVWKIPWAGAAWGSPFQWNTSVNAGGGVALSANGDVYFSDYEFNDGRIVVANVNGTGSRLLATQVVGNIGLSLSGVGLIYVTNAATGQVTEYPTDADGDCAPVRTISVAPHNIEMCIRDSLRGLEGRRICAAGRVDLSGDPRRYRRRSESVWMAGHLGYAFERGRIVVERGRQAGAVRSLYRRDGASLRHGVRHAHATRFAPRVR